MTIVPKKKSDSRSANKGPSVVVSSQNQQEERQEHHDQHSNSRSQVDHHRGHSPLQCTSTGENVNVDYSGYNSGDEHTHDRRPSYMQWTEQEYQEKEIQFEKKINKKGWVIKKMAEDGACLFRAVADQIYGDQEMHSVVRKLCIDYIAKNSDYYSQYVTEDFSEYLRRKSLDHSHGNHIEIQAMSEMFNRPIEVYHYSSEPINIFQMGGGSNGATSESDPIRLSYHRSVHYNSIINPFKATVGVGLGLPAYDPGMADRSLLDQALRFSEEDAIEKAMLEDKLLATDWEATNEAIEEQVARESYLEWLRENESRMHKRMKKSSSPQPTTTAAAEAAATTSTCSSVDVATSSKQHQFENQFQHQSPNSKMALNQMASCSSSTSPTGANRSTAFTRHPDAHHEAGTSASSSSSQSAFYSISGSRLPLSPSRRTNECRSSSPKEEAAQRRSPRASSSRDVS